MINPSKKKEREKLFNKIMWLPIALILAVVPLIVRMVQISVEDGVMDTFNQSQIADVYSNYKATAIVMLCVIMAVLAYLCLEKKSIKMDQVIKCYIVGAGIFLVSSLVATILSNDTYVAWWGMPDRAEGFIIIMCYIFIMFYTLYILRSDKNYNYIIGSLSFLIIITTIIGAFQFFGYDLFTQLDFFKKLIIGKEGVERGYTLASNFDRGKVFGTMTHYNYMGSFGAMMVPFFLILTIFIKNKKQKIGLGIITLCTLFLLFGSTSRAGLIGLVASITVGIIVLIKPILRGWKITVPIVGILGVILIGLNILTNGTIFSRIPTLVSDVVHIFADVNQDFDYREHIPIREISYEEGKEKLVFQTGVLYLGNEQGQATFTDENGDRVEYRLNEQSTYTTLDERFNLVSFKYVGTVEGQAPVILAMVYNNMDTFCFMLDDQKGVMMIDTCPIEEMEIVEAEAVGFKGKEQLGSSRGYIWSRSIPMMKQTWLIGFGPDNYALHFPQDDLLAKWWAYGTPNMVVDKPHNLYLNIWLNLGGPALVGFMIIMLAYLVQCFRLYALKYNYELKEILGIATMLAIVGYLGAGVFNDSVVSVAPIFWAMLGAGMGINFWCANRGDNRTKKF